MAEVSLEVPEELVGRLRESVLLLYEASAEALHLALRERGEGRVGLDDVRRQRARVARLEDLLDQLDGGTPGAVAIRGPSEVLHDALYGALIEAGERLAVDCEASWRDGHDLEGPGGAARCVITLDALLRRVRG